MVNGLLNSCMPGGVAAAGTWHAKSICNVLERAFADTTPEGEKIDVKHAFL